MSRPLNFKISLGKLTLKFLGKFFNKKIKFPNAVYSLFCFKPKKIGFNDSNIIANFDIDLRSSQMLTSKNLATK